MNPGGVYTAFVENSSNIVKLKAFSSAWDYNYYWFYKSHDTAVANELGEIWVSIEELNDSLAGATYALSIEPYVGESSEGTKDTPVLLTVGDLPFSGTVGYINSHYKITGLSPNTSYEIKLDNSSNEVRMRAYANDTFAGYLCDTSSGNVCQATTNTFGEIWLEVYGKTSKNGATYNLTIQ